MHYVLFKYVQTTSPPCDPITYFFSFKFSQKTTPLILQRKLYKSPIFKMILSNNNAKNNNRTLFLMKTQYFYIIYQRYCILKREYHLINDFHFLIQHSPSTDINYWTSISNRSEEHTSELQSRGHLVC